MPDEKDPFPESDEGPVPVARSDDEGPRPGSEVDPPQEDEFASLGEEERVIEEAARVPASGRSETGKTGQGRDRGFLLGVVVVAAVLCLAWIGGTAILQLRKDIRALDERLLQLQKRSRRGELLQARAALSRAQAELESIRPVIAPELKAEVRKAERVIEGISDRIHVGP